MCFEDLVKNIGADRYGDELDDLKKVYEASYKHLEELCDSELNSTVFVMERFVNNFKRKKEVQQKLEVLMAKMNSDADDDDDEEADE